MWGRLPADQMRMNEEGDAASHKVDGCRTTNNKLSLHDNPKQKPRKRETHEARLSPRQEWNDNLVLSKIPNTNFKSCVSTFCSSVLIETWQKSFTQWKVRIYVYMCKDTQNYLGRENDRQMQPRTLNNHPTVKHVASVIICACVCAYACVYVSTWQSEVQWPKNNRQRQPKSRSDLVAHGDGMTIGTPADVDVFSFGAHRPCWLSRWTKKEKKKFLHHKLTSSKKKRSSP